MSGVKPNILGTSLTAPNQCVTIITAALSINSYFINTDQGRKIINLQFDFIHTHELICMDYKKIDFIPEQQEENHEMFSMPCTTEYKHR